MVRLARPPDRRVSRAQPGPPSLPAACGAGAIPARPRWKADQARQSRSSHRAGRPGPASRGIPGSADASAERPSPSRKRDSGTATPSTYSPALVAAVKKVQGEWGFKPDGVIGSDTVDALNAGPAIGHDSWHSRWSGSVGCRVDAPAPASTSTRCAFLDYFRDGQHVDHRNVVAGQRDKPTPQLQSPIVRLVAKPTWTVPKGIGVKELATKSLSGLREPVRPEGRPIRSAVGTEEFARPRQIRHAGR